MADVFRCWWLRWARPTRFEPTGTILFIEDIAAKPYQIDRMLMQLKLAGKLRDVRGNCLWRDAGLQSESQDYTLEEVVLRVVGESGDSCAFGLRSGHVSRRNITLPIGVRASLDVRADHVEPKFWKQQRRAVGAQQAAIMSKVSESRSLNQSKSKHIHLIGICGTAMASLAGMLQAARLSRHRLGCGGVSADVGLSWQSLQHSGRAAVCRGQSAAASRSGGRGQRHFAR